MAHKRIGQKIKEARKRLGWSIAELARITKVNQRTLEDIEGGVTIEPGHNNVMAALTALASALGEPIVSFFDLETGGRIPAEYLAAKGVSAGLKQATSHARAEKAKPYAGVNTGRKLRPRGASPEDSELKEIIQHPERFDRLYLANVLVEQFLSVHEDARGVSTALLFERHGLAKPYLAALGWLVPKHDQK